MSRRSSASLCVLASLLGACDSAPAPSDAAVAPDAASDAPVARDGGGGTVRAIGNLAILRSDLSVGIAEDWRVCTAGTSSTTCDDVGIVGDYVVEVPQETELALRAFDPADSTAVPWLRPIHPGTTDVQAQAMAMPDRDLFATLTSATGASLVDRSMIVVYVERPIPGMPLTFLGRGVSGYTVTSSVGTVHYVAADIDGIDTSATATTIAGLVIVTDVPASAWVDGAALDDVVRVSVAAPPGESLCRPVEGTNAWVRAEDASSYAVDAPVLAGHVTYATFLTCPSL